MLLHDVTSCIDFLSAKHCSTEFIVCGFLHSDGTRQCQSSNYFTMDNEAKQEQEDCGKLRARKQSSSLRSMQAKPLLFVTSTEKQEEKWHILKN